MKKGKITMVITVGIACFILIAVMTMQFKIINETNITDIENMREAELTTELANWKSKYEETNLKYEDVQNTINEYKQTQASAQETSKLIDKELEQANITLGLTDVEGEGIVITINDSTDEGIRNIDSDDLLLIVNSLKSAGAEAISINEERITNISDIVYINYQFIKVNGQRVFSPYVIKAIGDPSYLEGSLIGNGGHVDDLRKIGHSVLIEKQKVKIEKYKDEIKTKYIMEEE